MHGANLLVSAQTARVAPLPQWFGGEMILDRG
jgi:hypothetical protein